MIRLFRPIISHWADEVRDELLSLCIKHEVIPHKTNAVYIQDKDRCYLSAEDIRKFLLTLKEALDVWYRFDQDSCLCKEDAENALSNDLKEMFNRETK